MPLLGTCLSQLSIAHLALNVISRVIYTRFPPVASCSHPVSFFLTLSRPLASGSSGLLDIPISKQKPLLVSLRLARYPKICHRRVSGDCRCIFLYLFVTTKIFIHIYFLGIHVCIHACSHGCMCVYLSTMYVYVCTYDTGRLIYKNISLTA